MSRRTDIQQLVIPEKLQDALAQIASIEERSMSGSVRIMIAKRAKELGLQVEDEESDEPLAEVA